METISLQCQQAGYCFTVENESYTTVEKLDTAIMQQFFNAIVKAQNSESTLSIRKIKAFPLEQSIEEHELECLTCHVIEVVCLNTLLTLTITPFKGTKEDLAILAKENLTSDFRQVQEYVYQQIEETVWKDSFITNDAEPSEDVQFSSAGILDLCRIL